MADVFIIEPLDLITGIWAKLVSKTGLGDDKPGNYINMQMVSNGWARYEFTDKQYTQILNKAHENAKDKGLGIYSPLCRQTNPPVGKLIKGNIRDGLKVYYPVTCKYYGQVIVDTSFGDQWFGNTKVAQTAGFTLAPACK
jgi:hypothetical protein